MCRKYIDIHRHFDGCLTVDIIKKLASMVNLKLPTNNDLELKEYIQVSDSCSSIEEYLEKYDIPLSLLQTKECIEEAMYLVLENCIKENLIYVELRFAPQLHLKKGLTQEEVVLAALKGLKRSKMKANLILCMMRGYDNDLLNYETIDVCSKYLVEDGGVVALDIAGSELLRKNSEYTPFFKKANELGIPFTIHSGETDGSDSVKEAIKLGAKRIGHGLYCYLDKELLDYITLNNIVLEMCPYSNMFSKACLDIDRYPFKRYLKRGIKVTLNVDGPAIQGTYIQDEFKLISFLYELTDDDYKTILYNSIYGAFTSNKVKEELKDIIENCIKKEA